ncbi:hypothetical protein [Streptomyces geranii]|uniref:hypothetical protein n=1 Tax=Streptomyces geranii TaxID=2058923 RepID=UPI0018E549CA
MIDKRLGQHPELSLIAIGLGRYIQSLPTGAPVDVETLARRFSSDNPDEIAAALRELETHGFLQGPGEAHPK